MVIQQFLLEEGSVVKEKTQDFHWKEGTLYTEIPIDPYKDTNDTASNNNKTRPDVEINAKLFK